MKIRQAAALTALAALCGCALWDQNTFQPSPEAPPKIVAPPPAMPAIDKRTPLLTIGFAKPDPDYENLLKYAVQQARERRPGVAFDVVSVVPASGGATKQALAASSGVGDAAKVMRSMIALGVPDTSIHLGTRPVTGATERQVLVYVR